MRRISPALPLLLGATLLTTASPASAVTDEQTPCGGRVLMATHAASADSYDRNGDRLECWPHVDSSEVPSDNHRLNSPTDFANSRKFYSFGETYGRTTSITFIDPQNHTFGGPMEGQEDDPDFDGCQNVCTQTLGYDSNDYFYFDTGTGSTKVSMDYFESHVLGLTRFSMVYSRTAADSSVFSFQLDSATITAPGQPSLRVASIGSTTMRLAWTPPSTNEGGTPTSYTFAWRASNGDSWSRNYPAGDDRIASPFLLTGLEPRTTYRVTLVAINGSGQSTAAQQTARTASSPSTPASRPRDLTARPGNHKAFLSWRAPLRGQPITAYQVRRGGTTYLIRDPRRLSVTIRGLTNHRLHVFTVRARNAAGWGPWSASAKVRPR